MADIIIVCILAVIGFILMPIVLRLILWSALQLGIMTLSGGAGLLMAFGLLYAVGHPEILLIPFAIIGFVILLWTIRQHLQQQQRKKHIQQMRQYFADEMEIRLRNEGYYLPPPKRREP